MFVLKKNMDASTAAGKLSEVLGKNITPKEVTDYFSDQGIEPSSVDDDVLLNHATAFDGAAIEKAAPRATRKGKSSMKSAGQIEAEPLVTAVIDQVRHFGTSMEMLEQDAAALIGARARAVGPNVAAIANRELRAAAGDIHSFRVEFSNQLAKVRTDLGLHTA